MSSLCWRRALSVRVLAEHEIQLNVQWLSARRGFGSVLEECVNSVSAAYFYAAGVLVESQEMHINRRNAKT